MHRVYSLSALAALLVAMRASGAIVTYDFEGGDDQGFGHKFADPGGTSETFPIVSIGGSKRMEVLRNGDFQEAERVTSDPSDLQYLAMDAASNDEAGYLLTYDWYVDTSLSLGNYGTFLQVGTYVNTGNGYFAQDFPAAGKDVELDGAQLASGGIFSGTISETFSEKGFDLPTGQTFFRLGLIINGDGSAAKVYFDNISISPVVPEPSSALMAMAIPAFFLMLRPGCRARRLG
jgi:hypothetical protein